MGFVRRYISVWNRIETLDLTHNPILSGLDCDGVDLLDFEQ